MQTRQLNLLFFSIFKWRTFFYRFVHLSKLQKPVNLNNKKKETSTTKARAFITETFKQTTIITIW